MRTLITLIACLYSFVGFAQTKLISYRSHSGSNTHFRSTVENDLFDIGTSNFGIVEVEKIDSVIKESKDRIIVIRRTFGTGANKVKRDTLTNANNSEIFAATDAEKLRTALHLKYIKASVNNISFVGFGRNFKSKHS